MSKHHAMRSKLTQKWQKRVFKVMDSGEMQAFLGILLMTSLFINESWVLGTLEMNRIIHYMVF